MDRGKKRSIGSRKEVEERSGCLVMLLTRARWGFSENAVDGVTFRDWVAAEVGLGDRGQDLGCRV